MMRLLIALLLFTSEAVIAQLPKLVLPLGHHTSAEAVFSPDNKLIVTASSWGDPGTKVWEASSGKLLYAINPSIKEGGRASFSPDGRRIMTYAFNNGLVQVWDAYSGKPTFQLEDAVYPFADAVFSADSKYILTNSLGVMNADSTAKLWRTEDGGLERVLSGKSAQYSPDGKWIFIYSVSGEYVSVIDAQTGKEVIQDSIAAQIKFSPGGNKCILFMDTLARIYDLATQRLVYEIQDSVITSVFYSPDGKVCGRRLKDGAVKVWNSFDGKAINSFVADQRTYNAFFNSRSNQLLIASEDSTIKVWDIISGRKLATLNAGKYSFNITMFSTDGHRMISCGGDEAGYYGPVRIWDLETFKLSFKLTSQPEVPWFFNKTASQVIRSSFDGSLTVWNALNGKRISELKSHISDTRAIVYSSGNDTLYSITNSDEFYQWDTKTLKTSKSTYPPRVDFQLATGFTFLNRLAYLTFSDSTIQIWDLEEQSKLKEITTHFVVDRAKLNDNGTRLVALGGEQELAVWNTGSGNVIAEVQLPIKTKDCFFSANSAVIFTIPERIADSTAFVLGFDLNQHQFISKNNFIANAAVTSVPLFDMFGNISSFAGLDPNFSTGAFNTFFYQQKDLAGSIVDLTTGKEVLHISGLREKVHYSVFNRPGTYLFTSGSELSRIWEANTGKLISTLATNSIIKQAIFSKDSKHILLLSGDNQLMKWDVASGKLLYSFISVDTTETLVVDPEGHYDGTPAARKLLYFTCGTEVIELDQLKDQLWVPNLAERINKGETINARSLEELNICGLTPAVEKLHDNAGYHFKITPRRGGLGETVLFVNGIEARRYLPAQLKKEGGDYHLTINKNELKDFFVPGSDNIVGVKSFTSDNAIASRGLIVNEDSASQRLTAPNLYAVMVGVSKYKGEELDLKYAAKDAGDLSDAVGNAARKLLNVDGKEHVFMYNLTTATERYQLPEKKAIRKVLEEIGAKAMANDVLLIFFAGHGVMQGEKKQFYFLTADASRAAATDAIDAVGISTNELADWIKPQHIKAQKRILIFDACNSGQAINDFVKIGNSDQNYIAARNDDKTQQIKAIDKLNEKSGLFILSASATNQSAYEMSRYAQGLLTYALLKAIKQQPEILEDGKLLNVSRWFSAAEKTVSDIARESGQRQEPQVVTASNINIGLVDNEVLAGIKLPNEKVVFTASNFQNRDENIADDNLELSKAINSQFAVAARGSETIFDYLQATGSPDAYSLSGRYEVAGENVVVKVNVKQHKEIKYQFELSGKTAKVDALAKEIVSAISSYLQNKSR